MVVVSAPISGYQREDHQVSITDPDPVIGITGGLAKTNRVLSGGKPLKYGNSGNHAEVGDSTQISLEWLTAGAIIKLEIIGSGSGTRAEPER